MVSVAIITKNEEDNIGGCLESVKWADDIIVVDSGSDDGTADICERYGVRFYTEPWKGFSAQKSGSEKSGYFIPRKNFFLGRWIRHCGWYPDYTLRLFKKGTGSFGEREVHESLSVRGDTGFLKHPMEHYTYKSISDYLKRLDRYSTLAARELLKEKKRYGMHHIVFRPLYTFFHMYVIRLGFLDGYFGFMLSILYSFYTFSKYTKLRELQVTEQ
jgi:glycosyltransferase involved in cell wall biosynthesis